MNGTRAEIYSDQTFATTNGLTLNDGNNLFVTAGSNGAGTLVLSTKLATKLPTTVNFSYDLNGNLLSDGLKGFDYDDANQLVRVTVTNGWRSEFAYDALGRRRISKDYTWSGASWTQTNEVRYVWDGMAVLQERDGANAVQVTYTRGLDLSGTMQGAGGIGGLLARTDSSGTTFYHSDGGGNVTTMTDSSGNVVARYLYDPFGNLLAKSGPLADVNKYRFSSKEVHPNSGLYYYGYRFYEPNLQRWLNEDPIRERGGINLYGFVGNDPLGLVDPFGHWPWEMDQDDWDELSGREGRSLPKPVPATPDYAGMRDELLEDDGTANALALGRGVRDTLKTAVECTPHDGLWGTATGKSLTGEQVGTGERIAGGAAFVGGTVVKAVGKALKKLKKCLTKTPDEIGSYTTLHESGNRYHGKGPRKRSEVSGKEKENEYGDKHVATDWKPSANEREALKDEARRLRADGGVDNPNNYNKINTKGERYLQEDGEP